MNAKDYVLIAASFKASLIRLDAACADYAEVAGAVTAARDMGRALQSSNHRFDLDRFITACGLPIRKDI